MWPVARGFQQILPGRAGRIAVNRVDDQTKDQQMAVGQPVTADGGLRVRRFGKSGLLRLQPVKSEKPRLRGPAR